MEQTTIKPDVNQTMDCLVLAVKSLELALREMDSSNSGVRDNIDRVTACLTPFKGNILR